MPGRPGVLPWNFATFSGNEPVTTLSDNFSFLNNQINDSGIGFVSYAVDTGTANAYAITLTSPPVSYEAGMTVAIKPQNTNTGSSTINVSLLGNTSIVDAGGNPLVSGALIAGRVYVLVYDGASFRIVTPSVAYATYQCTAFTATSSITDITGWSLTNGIGASVSYDGVSTFTLRGNAIITVGTSLSGGSVIGSSSVVISGAGTFLITTLGYGIPNGTVGPSCTSFGIPVSTFKVRSSWAFSSAPTITAYLSILTFSSGF